MFDGPLALSLTAMDLRHALAFVVCFVVATAFHEYAHALDAERRNQQVVYRGYLLRAVELDPDFAVAHAKLAEHFAFNNDVPNSRRHGDLAMALADSLPPTEALRIQISVSWSRGDREAMVRASRT